MMEFSHLRKKIAGLDIGLDDLSPIQLSRIYRKSVDLKMKEEFQNSIHQAIVNVVVPKIEVLHATRHEGSPPDDQDWSKKRCDLRIRELVREEASWNSIKPFAWRSFRLDASIESAAALVELVYLYGTMQNTCDVISILTNDRFQFFGLLHEKVRSHLVFNLWKSNRSDLLEPLLIDSDTSLCLQPLEKLFVFYWLSSRRESANAMVFFQSYETDLFFAVKRFGHSLDFSEAKFRLIVGKMAVDVCVYDVARNVLSEISNQCSEYPDALKILAKISQSEIATHNLFSKLKTAGHWHERFEILSNALAKTSRLRHQQDLDRPCINLVFSDLKQWFPSVPECVTKLSCLIIENLSLYKLLPGLDSLYQLNATTFHAFAMEQAIWGPVWQARDQTDKSTSIQQIYWRGIGLLHKYIVLSDGIESILWEAKRLISAVDESTIQNYFSWDELHKVALAQIKIRSKTETIRDKMIRQIKVAVDPKQLRSSEIEEYLADNGKRPLTTLKILQDVTVEHKLLKTEKKVILAKAVCSHFTNQDLDRLWQISNANYDGDYAWRVASVLNARKALASFANQPWTISGENRAAYPFFVPGKEVIDLCLFDFDDHARALCQASVSIGPHIPELLAAIDPNVKSYKYQAPHHDTFEGRVEKQLMAISWIPAPKRSYRFSEDVLVGQSIQLPEFVQVFPNNIWSFLFLKLQDRLGISSWGWRLKILEHRLSELLPRINGKASPDQYNSKVAKWIKSLNDEQQENWYKLVELSGNFDDRKTMEVLGVFLSRLALTIYPAHYEAMTSLQKMRVPVQFIWGLESWILSEGYTMIRSFLGNRTALAVPSSVRRSILKG